VEAMIFSPDSKKLAYFAQPKWNRSSCIVVNGVEGKTYDDTGFASFSPDSSQLAYSARRRAKDGPGKERAVIDGKEGSDYETLSAIVFSPDSRHSAYLASSGGSSLVRDGAVEDGHGRFKEDEIPVFSPDSKRLAYAVVGAIIVDGKVFDGQTVGEYTHGLVFSPDSQHLAYVTRMSSPTNTGYNFAILDGVVQQESKGIVSNPYFTPDGKRLVYLIRGDGKEIPIYGELRGREYGRFVTCFPSLNTKGVRGGMSVPFGLDGSGTLHGVVLRDGEVFRLELKFVEE
jgi:Tol biopolymer transport system component